METHETVDLALEIGQLLKKHKMTLGAVESATGGLISHLITNIPGSSDYYQGSITSYSNEIKMSLVGVKRSTLDQYGAVSSKVAEEMAEGGRKALGVDICISDTGIAGPTGATIKKPIGLFYLGLSSRSGTFNRKHIFKGNREQNKQQAATAALEWLKEYLSSANQDNKALTGYKTKAVVTCILEFEKKILILKRSDMVSTYKGSWAGVSGYVETTPDQQALTEIREETGLDEKEVKLICKGQPQEVIDTNLKTAWMVHPYLYHVYNPDKIRLDHEHEELKWIDPGELGRFNTVPGFKETIDTIRDCLA